jgi:hypothetical protein
LVVTEFGVDAYDSMLGAENAELQGDCLEEQLDSADLALAVRTPGGVSSGQVVFEWLDEWWKAECDPGTDWQVQDTCNSFTNPAYPDLGMNEEWWGIVRQDSEDPNLRDLRPAYTRVAESWNLGSVLNLEIVTRNQASGDLTISFDPATGSTDHTLYYGPLSAVSSHGYSGTVTGLGAEGSSLVAQGDGSGNTLPAGSLFWVVVGRNNGAEGCYGRDFPACSERPCFPEAGNCSLSQAESRTCVVSECELP